MANDTDKFWKDVANDLAREAGFASLTPDEAQRAFDELPDVALPESEIEAIIEQVTSGELAGWTPESVEEESPELELAAAGEGVFQLNRNPGESDSETDALVNELRSKAHKDKPPTTKRSRLEWTELLNRQEKAVERAAEVLEALKIASAPIDPLAIAESEKPFLHVSGGDFRNRFDGQLEYHVATHDFILFFNTKYDANVGEGEHHPRTRFSIAHEMGHYFLEEHRDFLRRGGKSHPSRGEFLSDHTREVEADAFAAGLLMPSRLLRPLVNRGDLTFLLIEAWAQMFKTSVTSTARRSIELSDFPSALVGVREGRVAFAFHSHALIEGGCYPRPRGSDLPQAAQPKWQAFLGSAEFRDTGEATARDWFQTFDKDQASDAPVSEYYYGVPSMQIMLVLLTIAEDDLFPDNDDD